MPQHTSLGRVRDGLQKWMVSVNTTTHSDVHRHMSKLLVRCICQLLLALGACASLDGITSIRTEQVASVLDHAKNKHSALTEVPSRAFCVHQRQVRRLGDEKYA